MKNRILVYCDFDGTITTRDTVDVLLSELADPEWEAIEEQWVRGEISGRECMARQIPLIRGGWKRVQAILDGLTITPGAAEFVEWCRSSHIPFVVVSDGMDKVINYILQKNGINADAVFANHLIESASGEFSLQASARPRLAGCQSGVCKCQIVGQQGYQLIRVVIGDGRSDFCWSKEADLLYAKHKLVDHAIANGIGHNVFDTFHDIKASLSEVKEGKTAQVIFNKPLQTFVAGLPSTQSVESFNQ